MPAYVKIETKPEFSARISWEKWLDCPANIIWKQDWFVMPFNQMRGLYSPGVPATRVIATQIIFSTYWWRLASTVLQCNCTLLFPSLCWNDDQHKKPMIVDTSVQTDMWEEVWKIIMEKNRTSATFVTLHICLTVIIFHNTLWNFPWDLHFLI